MGGLIITRPARAKERGRERDKNDQVTQGEEGDAQFETIKYSTQACVTENPREDKILAEGQISDPLTTDGLLHANSLCSLPTIVTCTFAKAFLLSGWSVCIGINSSRDEQQTDLGEREEATTHRQTHTRVLKKEVRKNNTRYRQTEDRKWMNANFLSPNLRSNH